ncbi:polysaccharide deacetylase family protein [Fodinicola acaciae]|uniref:polysaccharide deacetylase family protein n=1 Tax=Fodinicola acaciae TaxID=2681555 RepID=UPI0013D1A2D2|nr:polysaccharide deacetylase family protein [Fodinicola acaciae]
MSNWARRVVALLAVGLVLIGLAGANIAQPVVSLPIPGVPVAAVRPAGAAVPSPRLMPANTVYEYTGTAGIALTFDDGPSPIWTPKVLQVLAKYHVHAVFCMVGFRVREHPELVRAVAQAGHTLCNHTVNHDPSISRWSPRDIHRDLAENNQLITAASGGVRPRYFRSPQGLFTPRVVEEARRLGLASLGWRVTAFDWQSPPLPPKALARNVDIRVRPGSIVLMHDAGSPGTHRHTLAALSIIIAYIQEHGWQTTAL